MGNSRIMIGSFPLTPIGMHIRMEKLGLFLAGYYERLEWSLVMRLSRVFLEFRYQRFATAIAGFCLFSDNQACINVIIAVESCIVRSKSLKYCDWICTRLVPLKREDTRTRARMICRAPYDSPWREVAYLCLKRAARKYGASWHYIWCDVKHNTAQLEALWVLPMWFYATYAESVLPVARTNVITCQPQHLHLM